MTGVVRGQTTRWGALLPVVMPRSALSTAPVAASVDGKARATWVNGASALRVETPPTYGEAGTSADALERPPKRASEGGHGKVRKTDDE